MRKARTENQILKGLENLKSALFESEYFERRQRKRFFAAASAA
jgi:hypothetical protein